MAAAFEGTSRYRVTRWLGGGASGDVYEVLDLQADRSVALELLDAVPAADLNTLAAVFPRRAELRHPNLAELLSLEGEGNRPFFTRELVHGPGLHRYLCGNGGRPGGLVEPRSLARMWEFVRQLAAGLAVLHSAGLVHGGLAPTEVRICDAAAGRERVVLLGGGFCGSCRPQRLAARYRAPELSAGGDATAASDLFSLGAIAVEALTGGLEGPALAGDPVLLRALAPHAPVALVEQCARLVAPEPSLRPSAAQLAVKLAGLGLLDAPSEVSLQGRSEQVPDDPLLRAQRLAQRHLLAGDTEQGVAAVRELLAVAGDPLPSTRGWARAALVAGRMQRKLTDVAYARRESISLEPGLERSLDACWFATVGLALVDELSASVCHERFLGRALRAGEPRRIARGLALEAALLAGVGGRARQRAEQVAARAEQLAEQHSDTHALAMCEFARQVVDSECGQWGSAYRRCRRAEQLLHQEGRSFGLELAVVAAAVATPMYYLGRLHALRAHVTEQLGATDSFAGELGPAGVAFRRGIVPATAIWLAEDDPMAARELVDTAWGDRSNDRTPPPVDALIARAQIALYLGKIGGEQAQISQLLAVAKQTGRLRGQRSRIELVHLQARAALAAADGDGDRSGVQLAGGLAVRRLEREHLRWASALARLVRAALGYRRGDKRSAAAWLRAAESEFDSLGMALYSAAARWRRGQLTGGRHGVDLQEQAGRALRGAGVRVPERFVAMLAPGFG